MINELRDKKILKRNVFISTNNYNIAPSHGSLSKNEYINNGEEERTEPLPNPETIPCSSVVAKAKAKRGGGRFSRARREAPLAGRMCPRLEVEGGDTERGEEGEAGEAGEAVEGRGGDWGW
ncbi:hypothetical protein HZH66_006792 [Vespula vulgaris]|uniref:Uncharacterized protein n=1 Tax=Vespula vulgaris TaxID=7454 RepID=A0A834N6R1_VESVU|nr:hypothetical protein HZH66_006792 [Vespula vulgaris]